MLRETLMVVCLAAFGAATFPGCAPQAAKDEAASQQQSASAKIGKAIKDKTKRKKAAPHVTTAK